ncbi:probable DNA gyrase subunit A, chloroplastic/mitochondrial isoform X1 [Ananas comosus]|uniref:DNA gyrase subunit A, chloroplastic/mitochondrial n=1 Tax=Ananas comosus TaxID=4615 RepID=A0A199W250_ANACO|nr:probable DNA gyrase subunit A, chloroplastic/mitochondrial isoform X1 [Ananas comosus]OAY83547.1 putative DNA gyrase subunit A, chloroplastic/mitochondrial [Ananas comosus]
MAFSTVLRLTSASLSRLRPPMALLFPSSLIASRRCAISDIRFLSVAASPRRRGPVRTLRARRGGRDDETAGDGGAKGSKGDDGGNGGVMVKERSGGVGGEGRVVPAELHKEATEAYMAYAMSVLLGRALPDVRDGLKPVHRRILFAMHELGLASRRPFRKCARVVGEVLGKFHPHGDTAVYESLVRMAQDFSMRHPLIRGHGNFGSIDADPPAAMRYTECRLEALAEAMLLTDLELNTVDFAPNFDNSQKEPSVLPARIPTLLLNGSSGIAVGMATNIPPHNLGELVDALSALIQNPEATLQELLEYMPGPDFPTGGLIMGNEGILEAYRTGRGRVIVRGKTEVEMIDERTKRDAIIIKEIPYQTNKSALVEKIAELVEDKILEGISDIRDESDRSGMRIVIELKRGSDPSIVLNNLFRHTALQSSFSCNMVGIIDGQPKLMGLKEILQAFLDFRCSVVERRAKYKLSQAQERKHIVEGIMVGLDNLDAVIHIIKGTSNNTMAIAALVKEYGLSEKQAEALLDITLRKLTSLERKRFVDEAKSLSEQISKLNELLSSKKLMFQLIEQEAVDLKNRFGTPRRSLLEDSANSQLEDIDVIPNEEMLLILSEKGYLKRMKPNTFNLQHRGTIGKSVGKMRVNDSMSDFIVCHTHDHILYFSDKGVVYSARAYRIPECTRTAAGTPLIQLLSLSEGERITSIIPVSEFGEDQYLLMLTLNGYIKKVPLNAFSAIRATGIISIQLVPGDELKWVRRCANDDLVAIASQNGMVIVNYCNKLRAFGRRTRGVISMRLKEGDKMAAMDIIPAAVQKDLQKLTESSGNRGRDLGPPWLLFASESGRGKRVPLSAFRLSMFNRMGLRGYKLPPDHRLAAVFVVGFSLAEDGQSDEQVVLVSQSGTVNRIKVRDIPIQSRSARGVILMRLEHAGKIQSASLISAAAVDVVADD